MFGEQLEHRRGLIIMRASRLSYFLVENRMRPYQRCGIKRLNVMGFPNIVAPRETVEVEGNLNVYTLARAVLGNFSNES